jgi:hypothetical protein
MSQPAGAARQGAPGDVPVRPSIGGHVPPLHLRLVALVLAGGLAAGVIVNWDRWVGATDAQWTDNAALGADLTPLSAPVAGRVRAVFGRRLPARPGRRAAGGD